jgi:hypothetical protein
MCVARKALRLPPGACGTLRVRPSLTESLSLDGLCGLRLISIGPGKRAGGDEAHRRPEAQRTVSSGCRLPPKSLRSPENFVDVAAGFPRPSFESHPRVRRESGKPQLTEKTHPRFLNGWAEVRKVVEGRPRATASLGDKDPARVWIGAPIDVTRNLGEPTPPLPKSPAPPRRASPLRVADLGLSSPPGKSKQRWAVL